MRFLSNYIYQILINHAMEANQSLSQNNSQLDCSMKDEPGTTYTKPNKQQISDRITELYQFNEKIKKFQQDHSANEQNDPHSNRTIYFDTKLFSSNEYKQMTSELTKLFDTFTSLVQDNITQSISQAIKDVIKIRSIMKSLTGISKSVAILQQTLKTGGFSQDEKEVRYQQELSEYLNEITKFLSQFIIKIRELINIKLNVKDYLESIKQLLEGIKSLNSPTYSYIGPLASQKPGYQSTSPKSPYKQPSHVLSQNRNYQYIKQKVPLMLKSTQSLLSSETLTKDYVQLKDNLFNVIKKLTDLKKENVAYKLDDSKIVDKISQDIAWIEKIMNQMIRTLSYQEILQLIKNQSESIHNFLKPFYDSNQNYNNSTYVKIQDLRDLFLNNKLILEETGFLEKIVENQSIQLKKIKEEKLRLQEQLANQKQKVIDTDNKVPVYYSKVQLEQEIHNAIQEYKKKEDTKVPTLIQDQQTNLEKQIQQLNKQLIQKNNQIQELKKSLEQRINGEFKKSNGQNDLAALGGIDLKQQIHLSYEVLSQNNKKVQQLREQIILMETKIRNYKIYDYLSRQDPEVMDLIVTTIKQFQQKAQQTPINQLIKRLSVEGDSQTTSYQRDQNLITQPDQTQNFNKSINTSTENINFQSTYTSKQNQSEIKSSQTKLIDPTKDNQSGENQLQRQNQTQNIQSSFKSSQKKGKLTRKQQGSDSLKKDYEINEIVLKLQQQTELLRSQLDQKNQKEKLNNSKLTQIINKIKGQLLQQYENQQKQKEQISEQGIQPTQQQQVENRQDLSLQQQLQLFSLSLDKMKIEFESIKVKLDEAEKKESQQSYQIQQLKKEKKQQQSLIKQEMSSIVQILNSMITDSIGENIQNTQTLSQNECQNQQLLSIAKKIKELVGKVDLASKSKLQSQQGKKKQQEKSIQTLHEEQQSQILKPQQPLGQSKPSIENEKQLKQLQETVNRLEKELNKSRDQLKRNKQQVINLINSLTIPINSSFKHNPLNKQHIDETLNNQDQQKSHQQEISKIQHQDQQFPIKIQQFIQIISSFKKSLSNKMSIQSPVEEGNYNSEELLGNSDGEKQPTVLLEQLIKITKNLFSRIAQSINEKLSQRQQLKLKSQQQQQKLEEIQKMFQQTSQKQQSIRHQITQLQGITSQKNKQIQILQKNEEQLRNSFAKTINENIKTAIQIGQITEQKSNLQKESNQQRQISFKLQKDINILKDSIKQLQDRNRKDVTEINQLKVEKQNLENSEKAIIELQEQIKSNKEKIIQLEGEKSMLETLIQKDKEQNKKQNEIIKELNTAKQGLVNETNSLKLKNSELEGEKLQNIKQITELNTAKQGLVNETNSLKLKNSELEGEKLQNIKQITELNTAKQGLVNEITNLKTIISSLTSQNDKHKYKIIQLKTLNTEFNNTIIETKSLNQIKVNTLISEKTHLLSTVALQKGINQQNTKQIEQLKESLTKITDQKSNFKLEVQKLKLQIGNHIKKQNELIKDIEKLTKDFNLKEIDFDKKIKQMQKINKNSQQRIAEINGYLTEQKRSIEVQSAQIDGLKKDNTSKQESIISLLKVQEEKIKLDAKVTQLTNKLNGLQNEFRQKERETVSINHQSKLQQDNLKDSYAKQISNLKASYENQRSLFEQKAKSKMEQMMRSFNRINSKLNDDKITYHEESLKLSSFLVAIYQAMSKMNEFYQPRIINELANERDAILTSIGKEQTLNQKQCQEVLVYSIRTIKMLENVIRQFEGSKNSVIAVYEAKVNQLINKIDGLKNKEDLKSALQNFSKAEATASISRKSTGSIDQVNFSFNNLIVKISNLIQQEQNSSTRVINQLVEEKQKSQRECKRQIQKFETKYKQDLDKQIKTKEREIQTLNSKITEFSSKLKTQEGWTKQLREQLNNKEQEIKNIKVQNQKYSFDINKSFKAQKDKLEEKIKQLTKLVEDLTRQLEQAKGKYSTLQSKSRTLQSNFNQSQSELTSKSSLIQELKQKLQVKQDELKDIQDNLRAKKKQLQDQKKLLVEAELQIDSLSKQLSQKEEIITTYTNRMKQLESEIQQLNQKYKQLQNQKNQSIKQLTKDLDSISTQNKQRGIELSKSNSLISKIIDAFGKKIGKQVDQQQLLSLIISYQPPVGMKLIYSTIFLGQDSARSQTIGLCEQFAGRKITKTERLGRFPDTTSIVHQVPKQNNKFPFIMLYKTTKGTVFGSFSLKLKEPTFFFSFQPSFEQQSEVKQWMPNNSDPKYPSVDFVQGKYIQYGSGELRLNCIDLKTISANSDIKGYYNFDWRTITKENQEAKIALIEVEIHKVEFE